MKKKTTGNNRPVSPEIYIRQRARALPIDKCYINSDWQTGGLANIAVVRAHPKGTFTAGLFLVDIIYGAIEFAGEIDIMPCKEFGTTKYLIEEDDDKIEFIQYEYGKDGKYCLSVPYLSEANKYLPKLKKNLGNDFLFECGGLEEDDLFMGGIYYSDSI